MAARTVPKDLERYIQLCEEGRLYESLARPGESRDDVKRKLFVVLYGRPQWRSELGDRFSSRFPTVAAMLRDLKRGNYRRVAWLMQHAESSVFIGAVCRRIRRERPETPVITIHDSLMTTPQRVGYVEQIINEEFGRLGVQPSLHREAY